MSDSTPVTADQEVLINEIVELVEPELIALRSDPMPGGTPPSTGSPRSSPNRKT
jgi:hypothetical protein